MPVVLFYLSLPFIFLVSILPFPLMYGVSDFLFFMVYRVAGYRKKVVLENLRKSFPEKSEEEIHKISKQFYHYLCDLVMETFKGFTITRSSMLKHCYFKPESGKMLDELYAENRNIILVMGHYGNWEWGGNAFSLTRKHQLYVIYHEFKNKPFNKFIIKTRSRFGTKLIPMQNTFRDMLNLKKGPPNATAFITDQAPPPDRAHWMQFMNQDSPVFLGTEKFAKKFDYPVVYVSIKRKKRGYYELETELLFKNPKQTKEFEITERHTQRLEEDIRSMEPIWLWSHRRWKHKRKTIN